MDEVEKLAKELKDTLFGYETRGFESFDFNKELCLIINGIVKGGV